MGPRSSIGAVCRGVAAAFTALLIGGGAAAQEPIRIGAFLSVTGPASFLGDPELKTLELYVDMGLWRQRFRKEPR